MLIEFSEDQGNAGHEADDKDRKEKVCKPFFSVPTKVFFGIKKAQV